ncbi:4'-phosphopantetheinyl transferase [Salinisphaera sp. PC39]|uniref:4'-phosphopantetheinyl transferase family protein n=1 Tax=Salinisphaera sp. PC39 TaxID=1304156 RepID=UPI00333F2882
MPDETVTLLFTRLAGRVPASPWRPRLSAEWTERIAGMRSETARRRTLAGLWLLHTALPEADLGELVRDTEGRPFLPAGPAFNISHCGDGIACAVGGTAGLGLDIERVRPVSLRRFARFLTPEQVPAAHTDPAVFFRAWTAREATVKAGGRVGLARIARVRIDGDRATLDGDTWHLQWPTLAPNWVACLATAAPTAPAGVTTVSAPPV